MDTLDALFEKLGGPSGVGRLIGKSTEHAAAMKRRRSIPVRYWPKLIEGAVDKHIFLSSDVLVAMHGENTPAPSDLREAV